MAVCIVRLLLLSGAYAALPWLIGEAQYVSLESEHARPIDMNLPNVVHARARAVSRVARLVRTIEQNLPKSLSSSSVLFCISAEESICLLCLAVLERMHADIPQLLIQWRVSLTIVILLIVIGLPLCASILLCFGSVRRQWRSFRGFGSLSLFVAWCMLFLRVPLPMNSASMSFFQAMISRTAVLGVSLIAALSGSIAAGAIYDSYEMMICRRWTRGDYDLASMRASFQKTCADLQEKRTFALELEGERDAGGSRNEWSRFFRWNSRDRQLSSLHAEISGLVALANALRKDIAMQELKQQRIRYASTWMGFTWMLSGYVFSGYCAMRLAQCVLNLTILGYKSVSTRDLISTSVAQILRLIGLHVDVAQWSPSISVMLLGALIVMRTHVILGSLSSVIQSVSTGISTQLLVLFTAQVLCIYVLAALIQLHAGVSLGSTGEPSRLLASLPDFQRVFGRIFDIVFLCSAALVAAYRWFVVQSSTPPSTI